MMMAEKGADVILGNTPPPAEYPTYDEPGPVRQVRARRPPAGPPAPAARPSRSRRPGTGRDPAAGTTRGRAHGGLAARPDPGRAGRAHRPAGRGRRPAVRGGPAAGDRPRHAGGPGHGRADRRAGHRRAGAGRVDAQLGPEREVLPPATSAEPITVVVATRNRADSVQRCVRAVLAGDHPALTVLVVDNDPPTTARARRRPVRRPACATSASPARCLRGRNRGLTEAPPRRRVHRRRHRAGPGVGQPDRRCVRGRPGLAGVSGPVLAARLDTPQERASDVALAWNKGFTGRPLLARRPAAGLAGVPVLARPLRDRGELGRPAGRGARAGGFDEALGPGPGRRAARTSSSGPARARRAAARPTSRPCSSGTTTGPPRRAADPDPRVRDRPRRVPERSRWTAAPGCGRTPAAGGGQPDAPHQRARGGGGGRRLGRWRHHQHQRRAAALDDQRRFGLRARPAGRPAGGWPGAAPGPAMNHRSRSDEDLPAGVGGQVTRAGAARPSRPPSVLNLKGNPLV